MRFTTIAAAVLAAVATVPPAARAGDYTVGVIVPLSGQVAFIGEAAVKAMTLKVEQINAAGGINGHKLKLEARPTQKISIDGEIAAETPVMVRVADACIEVAAPRAGQMEKLAAA